MKLFDIKKANKMNETTAAHKKFLNDNNVRIYRNYFEYKGIQFEVKSFGSKFYAVNLDTKQEFTAFATKTTAIWFACIKTV